MGAVQYQHDYGFGRGWAGESASDPAPEGENGVIRVSNHIPVTANPADPRCCYSGREDVEFCTPKWYREGPEATWLAEATLASQLGIKRNEGRELELDADRRNRRTLAAI